MSATGFQRARRLAALRKEVAIAEGRKTPADIEARVAELMTTSHPQLNLQLETLRAAAQVKASKPAPKPEPPKKVVEVPEPVKESKKEPEPESEPNAEVKKSRRTK